jgi:hypothetical protein
MILRVAKDFLPLSTQRCAEKAGGEQSRQVRYTRTLVGASITETARLARRLEAYATCFANIANPAA